MKACSARTLSAKERELGYQQALAQLTRKEKKNRMESVSEDSRRRGGVLFALLSQKKKTRSKKNMVQACTPVCATVAYEFHQVFDCKHLQTLMRLSSAAIITLKQKKKLPPALAIHNLTETESQDV